MSIIEIVLRTMGATAAIIMSVALLRIRGAPAVGRLCGSLFLLGVAAYLPCSAGLCLGPTATPAALLASGIPFFFWGWTRSIMDDHFRLHATPFVTGLILIGSPMLTDSLRQTSFPTWGIVVHSLLGIAFVTAALFSVLRTWREDLIEARRRLRLLVLVVSGTYSFAVLSVELFLRNQPATATLQLVNVALLAVMLLSMAASLLSVSSDVRLAFGWMESMPSNAPPVQPAATIVRGAEQELLDKLHVAMTGNALYRDTTLSIAALAKHVGVHEKLLRAVVNRLGHKNFPSYVNAFRIEEVRVRLADARNKHLPILTLALDAGFGSIVAFNRAFKDKFAMTPSDYRAKAANEPATNN